MTVANGIYLYCIGSSADLTEERVSALESRPADGSDAALRAVRDGELAALVSDTAVREFEIVRDQLMAHHHVLEEAMTLGDILPVSFGTVADTEQDVVQALLKGTTKQLQANLERIRGRVELALRVMWNRERLFEEIVAESEEVRGLRDVVSGVSEEESFYERIRLGELTSEAIESKREYEREQILRYLEPLSVDVQVKPSKGDMLILNGSFLVDRERESDFDEAVQEMAAPRQGRMTFRYLGPLPPASFVSVFIPGKE